VHNSVTGDTQSDGHLEALLYTHIIVPTCANPPENLKFCELLI